MRVTGLVFGSRDYIGSVEPPATVLEDIANHPHNGSMTTAKPDLAQLPTGLWYWDYNATDAVVTVGDLARTIKTVSLWIYADDVTSRSILDLDAGTNSIEIDGSSDITATGWSTPTIYVDGAVAARITVNTWHHIVVTTATAIDCSNVKFGQEASYFSGYQTLYRLLENNLSIDEVVAKYQEARSWFGK